MGAVIGTITLGPGTEEEIRNRFCVLVSGSADSNCIDSVCSHDNQTSCSETTIKLIASQYLGCRSTVLRHVNKTERAFDFMRQISKSFSDYIFHSKDLDQNGIEMNDSKMANYLSNSSEAVLALIKIHLEVPGANWRIYQQSPYTVAEIRDTESSNPSGDEVIKFSVARSHVESRVRDATMISLIKEWLYTPTMESLGRVKSLLSSKFLYRLSDIEEEGFRASILSAITKIDAYTKRARNVDEFNALVAVDDLVWLYQVVCDYYSSKLLRSVYTEKRMELLTIPIYFTVGVDSIFG